MEKGKSTWRVMLAAINAFNDGTYAHCSTAELRSKFGLCLKNQPEIFRKLIDEGWIADYTINGYYKRFKILKPYPSPDFILDSRLNNPQKNLLLKCLELGIDRTLSKKEISRRLYNTESLSHLNVAFNKIEKSTGQSVLDILEYSQTIIGLVPENAIYTEFGYRTANGREPVEIISEENKIARFLYKKSLGRAKKGGINARTYTLTEDIIEKQLLKQRLKDYYTGIIPQDYKEYSIDRIDSSKGYIEGNIVITTNKINLMKNDLSLEEFKNQITLLYNNLSDF